MYHPLLLLPMPLLLLLTPLLPTQLLPPLLPPPPPLRPRLLLQPLPLSPRSPPFAEGPPSFAEQHPPSGELARLPRLVGAAAEAEASGNPTDWATRYLEHSRRWHWRRH